MTRVVFTLLAIAGLATQAAPSLADGDTPNTGKAHLEEARAALDELDYEKARSHLKRSIRVGDHDRRSLVKVYRLFGQVAAAFGEVTAAYYHYTRMLALDPNARLPRGLAPKLVAPFKRARISMAGVESFGFRVAHVSRRRLTIEVSDDPLKLVRAVEVAFDRRGNAKRRMRARVRFGRAVFRVPRRARPQVTAHAIDRFGNRLARLSVHIARVAEPARGRVVRTPQVEPTPNVVRRAAPANRSKPVYSRWYMWGLVAAATGGASLYFGLRALDDWDRLNALIATSGEHSFEEARRVEDSGRRNQMFSNITAGVAIGFASIAAYLLVQDIYTDEKSTVVPVVSNGGVSLALTGAF